MSIAFTKMQAIGNDFVILNALQNSFNLSPGLIQKMANRHLGIGFDQLLMITPPPTTEVDFGYRIFNSNGQEVGQCGNGARCIGRFIREQGISDKMSIRLATQTTQLTVRLLDQTQVAVDLAIPSEIISQDTLSMGDKRITFGAVNLGNPHAVLIVSELDSAPVAELGARLQQHPQFSKGVNVGFLQRISPNHIRLRVFERGVGETLGCGSGACAAVVIGHSQRLLHNQVTVTLPGGAVQVTWNGPGKPVTLTGSTETVFTGIWP